MNIANKCIWILDGSRKFGQLQTKYIQIGHKNIESGPEVI